MAPIHPAAAQGFTEGAETYTRGRPDYPPELRGWLERALGLGPGRTCVDLGAGTGKFSRLLAGTGATVLAVEPVAAMREQLALALPGLPVLAGTAQAMPLPRGSAQAVTCAQAFHWFAEAAALEEIHRVLAPGGNLGLVWNQRDESVDWVAALTAIMEPYQGDAPRYPSGAWRRAFTGQWFADPVEVVFDHVHAGPPRDVIVARILSVSFIARLPREEKGRVEGRILELLADHPELRGRETVSFPYRTHAYLCARLA